ncbi:YaiO family outer membrane beta-barrel protein [Ottowia flava]|uniref:YaiO family outer membrane beta-barrel protein n=1 Tax=Ottowia flava TaxID=2675430 RepID=A0ABW4KZ03_9BURK
MTFSLLALGSHGYAAPSTEGTATELEFQARARLARQADDPAALADLARALAWQERWDEAQALYERLLRATPDDADHLLGLAQIWKGRGHPDRALPLLRRARALAPDYQDVWQSEIQALSASGQPEQARKLKELAHQRFPDAAWAAAPPTSMRPATTVSVDTEFARLSGARGDRREQVLHVVHQWRPRTNVFGGVIRTQQLGTLDRYFYAGTTLPWGPGSTLQLELGGSSTHHIAPKQRLGVQWQVQPGSGWDLGVGWRLSRYDTATARLWQLSADRYWGSHQWGYTVYLGSARGANAVSHKLMWTYHLSDHDRIGISLSHGHEIEAEGARLSRTQVRSASLSGHHRLTDAWAATWTLGWLQYQPGYLRRGAHVGLRYTF